MRRYFVFFLCLCLAGMLWGCSEPPQTTVGMCLSERALPIHTAAIDALSKQIVPIAQSNAGGDPSLQLQQAEAYFQEDYSLLLAEPVDPQTAAALAELSVQYRKPILFTDFSPDHSIARQAAAGSHIGYDPAHAGILLEGLIAQLPNGGDTNLDGIITYLLVSGPEEDALSVALAQGCEDAMAEAYLLEKILCDGSSDSASALSSQALAAYGRDAEVILTTDDAIAQGVLDAIRDRGWIPGTDGYVLSISLQESARSLVADGKLSGLVIPDTAAYSTLITGLALDLLNETPKTSHVLAPWIAISQPKS